MTQPTHGSIVPYFGGKRSNAAAIVAAICERGVPRWFGEPFCGSMAVSLAMPEIQTHIVNDLNGRLINLATVLAWEDSGRRLIERLTRTLCCETVYEQACHAAAIIGEDPASGLDMEELAWAYAVSQWLGPNGSPQENDAGEPTADRFCVRWGPGGGDPATRWRGAVASLDSFRERLRRFTITRRDAFAMLGKVADDPHAAIYADPPYLLATRGSGKYTHDFTDHGGGIFATAEPDDHDRLADALGRFVRTRVVVSYYDDPRLGELYPAPKWRKIALGTEAGGLNNSEGETGRDRVEVLLVNDGRPLTL